MNEKIAFIGAGHMAHALIAGLIAAQYPSDSLWASNPHPEKLVTLREKYKIKTTIDNREAAQTADILILAVKPGQIKSVCAELRETVSKKNSLVISLAAGIKITLLQKWLGCDIPIIRAMPNIASIVGAGTTALFADQKVSPQDREKIETLFRAVGLTFWLTAEQKIDAITALSACGPAYIFLVMEALDDAARNFDLDPKLSSLLVKQTTLGAARLALESTSEMGVLRRSVTSPKGSTEEAIKVFEEGNLRQLFMRAVTAAKNRAEEISTMYEE